MYVYIDTTHSVIIGVLNKELEWIEYTQIDSQRSSEILHFNVYKQLSNHNLEIKAIDGVIYCAGPGSYTGMRVSDGFTKILELKSIPIYSFYQFEVPRLIGNDCGYWLDNAFKGELFVYEWDGETSNHFRIKNEEVGKLDMNKKFFSHNNHLGSLKTSSVKNLIKENSKKIFQVFLQKKQKNDLFYYRSIDDEFQRKM